MVKVVRNDDGSKGGMRIFMLTSPWMQCLEDDSFEKKKTKEWQGACRHVVEMNVNTHDK